VSAEFSLLLLMMMTVTLLLKLDGDDPETHYRHTPEGLGRRSVRVT
jgi:hypothetical protein